MKQLCSFVVVFALMLAGSRVFAQVGIGTITPDASAQLDVVAAGKGLLTPRMDKAGRDGIVTPATGLLIYQTNDTPGFYYFDGVSWTRVGSTTVVGFAATSAGGTFSISEPVTGWTEVYSSGSGFFNPLAGTYTVPETGIYKISALVNYAHQTAASISTVASPSMQIRKGPSTEILRSLFPTLNVNMVLVLSLRVLINTGTVPIEGTVALNAGDVLSLWYNYDGYPVFIGLGAGGPTDIQWSVTKVK